MFYLKINDLINREEIDPFMISGCVEFIDKDFFSNKVSLKSNLHQNVFNTQIGAILCFGNYFLTLKTYGETSEDHLWLGLILIVLIVITGMFSYYQDTKTSHIMNSFQQMVPQRAKVLRDGERKEVLATELVVGDIVLLETGDRVPADIRILECQGEVCPATASRVGFLFSLDGQNEPFSSRLRLKSATISRSVSFTERKSREELFWE